MSNVLKQCFVVFLLSLCTIGTANSANDLKVETFEVGFTSTGHPYKGNPAAPITLVEYSDYLCPFCARHQSNTLPELIEAYVTTGKLKIEFRHFPLASLHPTAHKGHTAAACAGDVSADAFWKFHDALFIQQQEWNRLPEPSEYLISLAEHQGLASTKWQNCFNENLKAKSVDEDIASGKSLEFTGTPTFQLISNESPDSPYTISGARTFEYFSNAIDAFLAGEEPPAPPQRPKPELPAWAKSEALASDPDRSGFTVSGDPTHGSDDAPLVIVEFTDYQCPSCAEHHIEVQPSIDRELIETGKVRWVSKHLPLPEHKNAIAAAAATECAAFQGVFKAMKNKLFENQKLWSEQDDPDPIFITLATEISVDVANYVDCLGSRKALEGVLTDVFEATTVTRATPSFIVLDGETGTVFRGTSKFNRFSDLVNEKIETIITTESSVGKTESL